MISTTQEVGGGHSSQNLFEAAACLLCSQMDVRTHHLAGSALETFLSVPEVGNKCRRRNFFHRNFVIQSPRDGVTQDDGARLCGVITEQCVTDRVHVCSGNRKTLF